MSKETIFIAKHKDFGVFWSNSQTHFGMDFNLLQPKISETLHGKIESYKEWELDFPKIDSQRKIIKWWIDIGGGHYRRIEDKERIIDYYYSAQKENELARWNFN